jgi:hypothetical protein
MILKVRQHARLIEAVNEYVPTAAAMFGLCELVELQAKEIAGLTKSRAAAESNPLAHEQTK